MDSDVAPAKSADDHAASIAHAILASKKGYADGGMVESEMPGDMMEVQSQTGDDFLTSDADTSLEPIENAHMPDDPEHEIEGMGESRKKMLSGILSKVRAKNSSK